MNDIKVQKSLVDIRCVFKFEPSIGSKYMINDLHVYTVPEYHLEEINEALNSIKTVYAIPTSYHYNGMSEPTTAEISLYTLEALCNTFSINYKQMKAMFVELDTSEFDNNSEIKSLLISRRIMYPRPAPYGWVHDKLTCKSDIITLTNIFDLFLEKRAIDMISEL